MNSRQVEFIQKALGQKNAEEEIKKILELDISDDSIMRDGYFHSPVINGELIPAITDDGWYDAYYNNGELHSFIHNGELIPSVITPGGQKEYHNNGIPVSSAVRMREIIAEKLLEAKENKLAEVLKLLA